MCLLIVRVQRSSPWQHASIPVFPPFYTIPIFPLLNRKIFHLLVSFLFLDAHCICCEEYYYCLRVFVVVYILVVFISCCWNCIYANFHCYYGPVIGIFKDRLPEAICCCLQTYSVNVVLLVMCCMCIPVFIVTSADISQLWVYLCYLLIYCLRLVVVVYKLVMFMERG